jgi:hypothetical protein
MREPGHDDGKFITTIASNPLKPWLSALAPLPGPAFAGAGSSGQSATAPVINETTTLVCAG